MTTFDFASYLQQRLGAHADEGGRFTVETLAGGLTNHTARATFSQPVSTIALPEGRELTGLSLTSVVLKQAPPYLAWDPKRPLSVDRQLVEKKAFQILAGEDPEFPRMQALAHGAEAKVHVPRLIWHDEDAHMLWIEDLGSMTTLSEVLLAGEALEFEAKKMQEIATGFGVFLSALFTETASPPASFVSYIASVSDRSGIYDYLADVVLNYLRDAGIQDAPALSERVRTGFNESDDAEPPKCVGMVDFWPENVLVELAANDKDAPTKCGLVDWEYFGVSDASSELGMFLAHLHVHMLNSATPPIAKRRIQHFTQTWLRSFVAAQFGGKSNDEKSVKETRWRPSNGFVRRLLLSHGRDLVRGVKLYSAKLDDASKRRLLEGGARSLRAAGESSDKIDVRFLRPTESMDADEADCRDIWEGLSILV
ncbi:hypothetical protein HYPSUDRAFT_57299 [Hypholoma sublateritium FD-334 SS-4]|uniref:Aminoglycoside phosphotransferase domain-containing protein n=1 Tax=Hypholoma sublateritium (strain FD-334 SS-4) TaxID=945553 RepID=A0A0D2M506_HYPSF|nr:hypothetical protein HYPSUDRAFT_57299 [Hypholoma sublateritium FD-334 SS-4]